ERVLGVARGERPQGRAELAGRGERPDRGQQPGVGGEDEPALLPEGGLPVRPRDVREGDGGALLERGAVRPRRGRGTEDEQALPLAEGVPPRPVRGRGG